MHAWGLVRSLRSRNPLFVLRTVCEVTQFAGRFEREAMIKPTVAVWGMKGFGLAALACTVVFVAVSGCKSRVSQPEPREQALSSPFQMTRRKLLPSNSHEQMLEELQTIEASTNESIDWLGDAKAIALRQQLAAAPLRSDPSETLVMRSKLAKLELRLGNEQSAIEQLRECRQLLNQMTDQLSTEETRRLSIELEFIVGVANLRLAETENCCTRQSPDSCLIPIRGSGIHKDRFGSTEAIKSFERVLNQAQPKSSIWLRALWLYNIAHMTLDQYPASVRAEWRIPREVFESNEPFPAFVNSSQSVGLATFSLSGGAIADDFNRDGSIDIVTSSFDTDGQLRLFDNCGGTFSERTVEAGLTGLFGGLNILQTDYDNDGFLDVLVLRGGWFQSGGRQPNSLLRNNGDGTFVDVTFMANLNSRAPTQTGSWADYDNDGDLDLYVGNETTQSVPIYSQLYRNNSDGTFTDVAKGAGVLNNRFSKAVIWGDYDSDGWPDLYVSNLGQPNRLYHNEGNGTFIDVAEQAGVAGPLRSFPAWFWDFDNDGLLDLYVSSYADDIARLAAYHLGIMANDAPYEIEPSALYRGDGAGGFSHVSKEYGLEMPTAPMGANFGDLDNDGYLDFYLGTGEPEYQNLMPNVMYHNQHGKRFSDVTMAGRFGHLQKGHAVVFADLDDDGDQDVFEQLGGAYPGDGFYDALFENPGFGNNWLVVCVVGRQSNRASLGVRIHLRVRQGDSHRSIYKHINSGGSFGANPLGQSIGLGKAENVESLEVFWPTTGITQTFRDIGVRQSILIVEEQGDYVRLPN